MSDEKEAKDAIRDLNGTSVDGQEIKVRDEREGTRTGKRSFVSLFRLNLLMVVGVVVLGVEEEEDTEMEGEEGTMEDMEGIG